MGLGDLCDSMPLRLCPFASLREINPVSSLSHSHYPGIRVAWKHDQQGPVAMADIGPFTLLALSALFALGMVTCDNTPQPEPDPGEGATSPGDGEAESSPELSPTVDLATLEEGESILGFSVEAAYLNDRDEVMGIRFVHEHTGFVLDLLQIESVPQAFVWVNSIPDSNRGEPHTQEHLLLGKGNVGRFVASLEDMSLAGSSAFTQRVRTAYHFNTVAGLDTFFDLMEHRLNALLYPDYTDEEIRREVRNFTVTEDVEAGDLRLEESGTVYTEMVSSFERASSREWWELGITWYGAEHPLALSSGGLPEGIREMTSEHIRAFHAAHYQLGNMGMVGAFSSAADVGELLSTSDAILVRLQPEPTDPDHHFYSIGDLPDPQPRESREVQVVEYPSQEAQDTVDIDLTWPPDRTLEPGEELLFSLFLNTLAGDPTTNLYQRFINSQSREIEVGASSVYAGYSEWQGLPTWVGLSGIPSSQATEELAADLRQRVLDELTTIASWEPGSPELLDFNRRILSRLAARQRQLREFVNSPPGFGSRGTGAGWFEHLEWLAGSGDFQRSLTRRAEHAHIEEVMAQTENIWAQRLVDWHLLGVEPYALVTRPSPALYEQLQDERAVRIQAETQRLLEHYGVETEQEAIALYQAEYSATTTELEELASQVSVPSFLDNPPLSLDDTLEYRVSEHPQTHIPMVASVFDNMSGATIGLALSLEAMTEDDLVYLSSLPALFRQVGVIEDGTPILYTEMVERLQNEVLGLSVWTTSSNRTDRIELVVRGSGTNTEEVQSALRWMRLVLYNADFRPENLARIRDVVSESLDSLRRTTQGREEYWVSDPAWAYRRQYNPLFLSTESFMTRTHNIHRLHWMLTEAPDGSVLAEVVQFLQLLSNDGATLGRASMLELLGALQDESVALPDSVLSEAYTRFEDMSEAAQEIAQKAALDLELTLADLPDQTLVADWAYLCGQMAHDLAIEPESVLTDLADLRNRLLRASGARVYTVGATAILEEMNPDVDVLLAGLDTEANPPVLVFGDRPFIWERLWDRTDGEVEPVFVGLVNPNTSGGVFLNSVVLTGYEDTDRDSLVDYLTSRLYGGGGAHSLFMKTWGAGLAYSNGVRADLSSETLRYYAERCPELPQTLRFVVDELATATEDPALVDYALSQVFESRSAGTYPSRGASMAADLADGRTPEQVARFRQAMLDLHDEPGLSSTLFERMAPVYGQVLPGYGPPSAEVEDAVYFVIGPEVQLAAYEEYLQSVEGPDSRVYRLYPRDFWLFEDFAPGP